jgi:biopolymer transport protein ExbD
MSRRKNHASQTQVELNLAAMLDMAFQLLTFFILTFQPAPVEGRINLRLPPPAGATAISKPRAAGDTAIAEPAKIDPLQNLRALSVEAVSARDGTIDSLRLNGQLVAGPARLKVRLRELLSDPQMPFDQVVIQAGAHLRYDALMSLIDVCTDQSLADGKQFTKLSLVEVADGRD